MNISPKRVPTARPSLLSCPSVVMLNGVPSLQVSTVPSTSTNLLFTSCLLTTFLLGRHFLLAGGPGMAGTTVKSTGTLSVVVDAVVWPMVLLGSLVGVERRIVDKATPAGLVMEEAVPVGRPLLLLTRTIDDGLLEGPGIDDDDDTMVSIALCVGVGAVAVVTEPPMHERALLKRSLVSQTAAQYGKPATS